MTNYVPAPQTPGRADHAADPNADARSRALRTFLQGLALDVLLAVCLVVYEAMTAAEPDWRLLLLTLAKTVLTTAAAYVMRRFGRAPATT